MGRIFGSNAGGITGLCRLYDEHGEAIEFDLIVLGLRLRWLGTDLLTWRDLKIIVQHLSSTSALMQKMDPENAVWGLQEYLLAEVVDTLHWLQWAKTKDAAAKPPRNQPDPLPRPGTKPKTEFIKYDVMTQDDAIDWLGWTTDMVKT